MAISSDSIRLISWNVNGFRAVLKKGFADFIEEQRPDLICLQEIKAFPDQVPYEWPEGYHCFWNSAKKPGYSGVMIASRIEPISHAYGIGMEEHDQEGRVVTLEFEKFFFVGVYTPNSKSELLRLDYRSNEWDVEFLAYVKRLEESKPVVFCGDLNVAHNEIDLKNPKTNRRNAGFTDEERMGFDHIVAAGYVDSFRKFHPDEPDQFTWWSYRANARARNVGWRIDYFCVSDTLDDMMEDAKIHPDVLGSDHCPVSLQLSGTLR